MGVQLCMQKLTELTLYNLDILEVSSMLAETMNQPEWERLPVFTACFLHASLQPFTL